MNKQKLAKRASLLHLNSISLADGMKKGSFSSLYHGKGIEFSGVREYLYGDDIRAIDWNVTARMAKPYVKVFEEERELDIFIVMDCSLSMATGSGNKSRIETAEECASLLALASLHNSSPVGLVLFDGKIKFSCAPKSGRDHAMLILSQLDKTDQNQTNGSCLENAIRGAGNLLRKRSLVFVISDFRTAEWTQSFSRLCQKNDVIALRITDPTDDTLPSLGAISFQDPETGITRILPTSSQRFSRAWREENQKRFDTWKKECIRHGGIPLTINTNQDPASELIKFFSKRESF